jgi:ribulose-5-phosphate 4-epimerase/fuculose-1-phosphate aldolase
MNKIKQNLAYAFQILNDLKLDDHTYTHLSARSERGFYIQPFGLLFSEVTSIYTPYLNSTSFNL